MFVFIKLNGIAAAAKNIGVKVLAKAAKRCSRVRSKLSIEDDFSMYARIIRSVKPIKITFRAYIQCDNGIAGYAPSNWVVNGASPTKNKKSPFILKRVVFIFLASTVTTKLWARQYTKSRAKLMA